VVEFVFVPVTAFAFSYILIPFIIRFARARNLFDTPGKRKIHKRITPSLGGAAIFGGFMMSALIWLDSSRWEPGYFLLPILSVPFTLGLLDDITHLKPVAKLLGQAVTASLVFFILDVRVESFYGLFATSPFNIWISCICTFAVVILLTNSFNLIDGIDGLAGTFSIIAFASFGTWFYLIGDLTLAIFCFAFVGGILAFLFQNWEPSKIFMGDTGSLVIGTMLSIVTIQFLNKNSALNPLSDFKFHNGVAAIVCVLIVPIVDTIRIIILRLMIGHSPFRADKRHIHHALVRLGLTHSRAVHILCTVHIAFLLLAVFTRSYNSWVIISFAAIISTALALILNRLLNKQLLKID
jgi:UDP-GlcNAc:undecaprenyl-phosphate/decaprenyl-phosphate GlcNAc-1-phosphate transferase